MAKEESEEERLAREVAEAHLRARVEHHDDGSKNSMPDASIAYPDGRLGWLEVVIDMDGDYARQQKALKSRDALHVDGLTWAWLIHLRHRAKINRLDDWLAQRLREAEAQSDGDEQRAEHLVLQDRLSRITYATPLRDRPPGEVVVRSAVFSHSHSTDDLSGWVDQFFAVRHCDVVGKMNTGRREEQHAFVWVTFESGPELDYVAALRGLPFHPPQEAPPLPAGITHLWIAGLGECDTAIAWFPDLGWHEVSAHWTETPTGRAMLEAAGRSHPHA